MSQTTNRHGGHILLECLTNLGAKHGFGVPGESYLAALDAMADGAFDFTLCRNEGGAAFMASAYGKLTGTPGICFVTRGPGATNAAIGVHTAFQDSTPMLLFVGQIGRNDTDREAFQELNYRSVFADMAKWVTQIDHIDRMPELIARAWSLALSGRPGPVVIALPEDMLSGMSDVPACRSAPIPEAAAPQDALVRIMALLDQAKKPVIIAGGGGWSPSGKASLQQFAEQRSLPVVAAFRCHDVIDNNSPSYVGDAGVGMSSRMADLLQEADCIFAINIRFGEMVTNAWRLFDMPNMSARLIHAHLSADEIGKIYQPDCAINVSPNLLMSQLCDMAKTAASPAHHQQWCQTHRAGYEKALLPPPQNTKLDLAEIIKLVEQMAESDAIITHGAGNFAIWPDKYMRFGTRRLLAPQAGAMGYGLPAAIAAFKARGSQAQIICFAGDGDIQMNLSELGTAMQAGAKPIILIYNNGSYGTIRMHQERTYPARVSGTELQNPDFVTLASAYGFQAWRVETTDQFAQAFKKALICDSAVIIELMQDVDAISPTTTITKLRASSQN